MGCYSHLSDDEREQIGVAEALGHSIGGASLKAAVWASQSSRHLISYRRFSYRFRSEASSRAKTARDTAAACSRPLTASTVVTTLPSRK
jgi:hypothetical protein